MNIWELWLAYLYLGCYQRSQKFQRRPEKEYLQQLKEEWKSVIDDYSSSK